MSNIWNECLKNLEDRLTLQQFSIWVSPIEANETKSKLILTVPNQNSLNWVRKNIYKNITELAKEINNKISVEIKLKNSADSKIRHKFSTSLLKEFSFENLVVGDANQIACMSAKQIAGNLKKSVYNPFIIYGDSGLGKTHLLQAMGWYARKKNEKIRIIYTSLIDFVKNLTISLRHERIEQTKLYYQSADLLLIDDIHMIAGKGKSQEEFFHIFNFLFSTKKQIVLTCDQPLKNIKGLEERLKSRFSSGLVLQLTPPELEMRAAILLKKAQLMNFHISEDIALFIAHHFKSNVRELEGALYKLKAYSDFTHTDYSLIDESFVNKALADILVIQKININIDEIQKAVCNYYGISISNLISNKRTKHTTFPRQIAIYLTKELTNLSLPEIGKNFGNRHHTTILHACKKINELLEKNETTIKDYKNIKMKLNVT